MKKRYTEEQIINAIKEHEAGAKVDDICRSLSISSVSSWKACCQPSADVTCSSMSFFFAFLAYCLHVTLAQQLRPHAGDLTPRSVLEKFAAVQMLDVHIKTTSTPHAGALTPPPSQPSRVSIYSL